MEQINEKVKPHTIFSKECSFNLKFTPTKQSYKFHKPITPNAVIGIFNHRQATLS